MNDRSEKVEFLHAIGISGILDLPETPNLSRMRKKFIEKNGRKTVLAQCFPFYSIMLAIGKLILTLKE